MRRLSIGLPQTAIVNFNIPAQPLSSALIDFARQAEVTLLLPSGPLEGLVSTPVHGHMAIEDALAQMLRCLPFRGRADNSALIVTYSDGFALGLSPTPPRPICETLGEPMS